MQRKTRKALKKKLKALKKHSPTEKDLLIQLEVEEYTGSIHPTKPRSKYFDVQETLFGYYMVLSQILTTYGIPIKFKTDKRTVFEYRAPLKTRLIFRGALCKSLQYLHLHNSRPLKTEVFRGPLH